jgi:hypothetical protein
MSSPTPVREKRWVKILYWPALIFLGIPALYVWALLHLAGAEFACACTPIVAPEWAPESRVIGGIIILVPLLIADWFVIWKYRDFKRKEKWEKKYTDQHTLWYAKTGEDRPKGPIKNKYYEP